LDWANRWAALGMDRAGIHPIPLFEIIDKAGGTVEFGDFF
jgi:hypothetical protein